MVSAGAVNMHFNTVHMPSRLSLKAPMEQFNNVEHSSGPIEVEKDQTFWLLANMY